jgi:glycerol kinase
MTTVNVCLDQMYYNATNGGVTPEGLTKNNLMALGITNQRETSIMWDKRTGKPLHNGLVWLDTRTRVVVKNLVAQYGHNTFWARQNTSNGVEL